MKLTEQDIKSLQRNPRDTRVSGTGRKTLSEVRSGTYTITKSNNKKDKQC
jgi:hypothetical protein